MLIYVFGNQEATWVKVGKTKNIRRRQKELRGSAPDGQERVFLAGVWGMDSDEKFIHHYFAQHQVGVRSPEYFHANDEVKDWLRWLRHQYYVATEIDQVDNLERVGSSEWLPDIRRRTDAAPTLPFGAWGDLDLPSITGDDYYTHHEIIAAARQAMGGIDLDPASHPAANREHIKAPTYYTVQMNGLDKPWAGRVWCNPPFNQWDLWAPKILKEVRSGRVEACCVLMANRSMSSLHAVTIFDACDAACQTRGRFQFWGPKATGSADDGHIIAYFGPDRRAFADAFAPIGPVLYSSPPREAS